GRRRRGDGLDLEQAQTSWLWGGSDVGLSGRALRPGACGGRGERGRAGGGGVGAVLHRPAVPLVVPLLRRRRLPESAHTDARPTSCPIPSSGSSWNAATNSSSRV